MPFVKRSRLQDSSSVDVPPLFVGRTGELLFFVHNVLQPDAPTHNILSISGQGGVGKSTLLARFIAEAHEAPYKDYCLTAIIDERQSNPVGMMEKFAQQLHLTGEFANVLKQYKEMLRRQQVERETFYNTLFESVPDIAGAMVEGIPIAGPLLREGARVATRHLLKENQPSQHPPNAPLWEPPLDDLTRAFVTELNRLADAKVTLGSTRKKRQRRIVLFFDTFEQLAVETTPWLLDHFLDLQVSDNVVLVVAGRDPIEHTSPDDPKRWLRYCDDDSIYWISLNSFTEDETRMYLVKKGITDADQITNIWHLSQGLPLYLGLLTSNPHWDIDPTKDVVVNFLRWIPEQESIKRQLALDAALLSRPFNQDDLEVFSYVPEGDRTSLYQWLIEQPFVRSRSQDGRYLYHDVARDLFSHHLYQISRKRYYAIRQEIAAYYREILQIILAEKGKEGYGSDEGFELLLAVVSQLLLLSDHDSHFNAINLILNAFGGNTSSEQDEKIAKVLRELSKAHSSRQISAPAIEIAELLLQYIEADKRNRLFAVTALLNKVIHVSLLSAGVLAGLYSIRGWDYFNLHLKDYQEAISDFNCALELDPRCATAYNGRGWSYLNLKQYEKAKVDFDLAIELGPNQGGAYNGRGIIYRALNDHQQAKADFERFIKVSPKNTWAYTQRGKTCMDLKEYQQAIADFEHALELDPYYADAYKKLRQVYVELNEHQNAACICDRLRGMNPSSPKTYTQRGETYKDLKEYQEAISDFNRALELDPNQVDAYRGRGRAYREINEYQRAIADFNLALEFDPNHTDAHYGLAGIYRELKEYQLAIANFNCMIEINPDRYWAYFQRGHTYLLLRDIRQARLDFTQSWELKTTMTRGRWMAEWSGMCQERHNTTKPELLETIAAINSENSTAHICQGVALWLRGHFEDAVVELKQATSLNPEDWDSYFWKGMICASLKQDEEAIAAIEKALELELPPILLTPLHWFEQERPDFYEKYAVPLLAKHV